MEERVLELNTEFLLAFKRPLLFLQTIIYTHKFFKYILLISTYRINTVDISMAP